MKLASLIASSLLLASFAQAKDRFLVQFKSEQGFKAMESYYSTTESSAMQSALENVHAIVLKTKDLNLVNRLKNHPEVEFVEAEKFTPLPKPMTGYRIARVQTFERFQRPSPRQNPADAGPDAVPEFKAGDATPWGILTVKAGDAWALSGAGAKSRVLVLDTGIDATHPAIAPNFEKGRNFAPNDMGQVVDSEYQDTEGHGTHCSGTILGVYNEQTGFTGVAPKAKLLMGRVCSADGCSNIAVAAGINWGIQEKVDVISMSLGGPMGSAAERTAVTKADTAGVVVVAASGNDGTGRVSFPGAFPTVVAVGAINSALEKTAFSQWGPELDVVAPGAAVISSVPKGTGRESQMQITVNGETKAVKSAAFSGTELFPTPLVNQLVAVPGLGKVEDFAQVNVAGKFALVSRGEIKFAEKVANAIAAKAVGVVIYNNVEGLMQGALSEDGTLINLPVVMIEKAQGLALVDELTRGGKVSGAIAVAPSDYASFDGTSMATPHVAGVVALIRSANKALKPAQVRAILTSTAKPLTGPNDQNQWGAGVVQADLAVKKAVGQ